jgi:uncharacterized protein YndB with AHSA1/START domain
MTSRNEAAHEVSVTRLIEASPEIVYRIWTELAEGRTSAWAA